MRQQYSKIGKTRWALGLGLGLVLAAPPAMAEIFSWRTEDGGYAYTDDRDQVPARYAAQVKVLPSRKLADYARFTPQDDAASHHYAGRLAERLSHLRALNATSHSVAAPAVTSAAVLPQRTISLSTGDSRAPEIQVPVGQGSGPIVVEPVNAKRSGDIRTRRVTVIRQGGETLAVIKGSSHIHNPATDIHDEDELEAGAPLR